MCFHPLKSGYPCGKCLECRSRIRVQWVIRCCIELFYSLEKGEQAFCTALTYDEDSVPLVGDYIDDGLYYSSEFKTIRNNYSDNKTLCKRDVQLFIKRLRKYCHSHGLVTDKLRYFICGEYGPNTHRPHYHAILFGFNSNVKPSEITNVIRNCWRNGFIDKINNNLCVKQIQYATQYLCKPDVKASEFCQESFRLISKGISREYFSLKHLLFHYNVSSYEEISYIRNYFKDSFFADQFYFVSSFSGRNHTYEHLCSESLTKTDLLYDRKTIREIVYDIVPADLCDFAFMVRDYLPSDMIEFLNNKVIPRYIRDKLFPYNLRLVLDVIFIVSSRYKDLQQMRDLGMNETQYLKFKEDLLLEKEKQFQKYYEEVCRKKIHEI